MEPLDLTEFELKTIIRPLTIDDYDDLIAMAQTLLSRHAALDA